MLQQSCRVLSTTFSSRNLLRKIPNVYCNWTLLKPQCSTLVNEHKQNNKDDEIDRQRKVIKMELHVAYESGSRVPNPELVKPEHYDRLLELKSRSARYRYYTYLYKTLRRVENEALKKELRKKAYEEYKAQKELEEPSNDEDIVYSLGQTSLFLRIRDMTMNTWRHNRLSRNMEFGSKLILDCSYDTVMDKRESKDTARQLMYCFSENRKHKEPFDLHLCNVNFQSETFNALHKFIPNMLEKSFPMNVHAKSYLELFPKQNCVYLTPHTKNELITYDPNAIYIIGGIVDKHNQEPISLGKAKELGLKVACLPLNRYLDWGSSANKCLTLNQVLRIMLDINLTGDWNYALRHVPKRKIISNIEQQKLEVNNAFSDNKRLPFRSLNKRPQFGNALGMKTFELSRKDDNRGSLSTAEKFKIGPSLEGTIKRNTFERTFVGRTNKENISE